MYGKKAQIILDKLKADGILNSEGRVVVELLNIEVEVNEKSALGYLLEEWLKEWMDKNNVYYRVNVNTQIPPDFYLDKDNTHSLLEVKSFDYSKDPNFDIANFDAYVRDLRQNAFRLDADYLIFGYSMEEGSLKINNIWLKKIWEITCPSGGYALRVQQKQGVIYNIRPYNFKTNSQGFQPFKTRVEFIKALRDTIAKYNGNKAQASSWFNEVKKNYKGFSGQAL